MWKNQFLKVKNNHLELEEHFIESKERELKDREVKNKRDRRAIFYFVYVKLIWISLSKKKWRK